jgi:putative hydrolase of the HAD superfamily
MPAGLLIDYGGVLTNPVGPVMVDFCRSKGLRDDALIALQRPGSSFRPELEAYERGEYPDEEFLPRFAAALGLTLRDMDDFLGDVRPDARMFRALEDLRDHGVPVGLLSNSWAMSAYPMELLTESFDTLVISAQAGMRKPEPRIFRHAAEQLGVAAADCVFVDDTKAHVAAAAEVGMTAIHHHDPDRTLSELGRLFGLDLAVSAGKEKTL